MKAMNWKDLADAVRWKVQPFVNGRYRPSEGVEMVDDINPADESVLCRFSAGTPEDVDYAVGIARARFNEGCWSDQPCTRRADVLTRLGELIVEHASELALLDTLEMGKPIQAALHDAKALAPYYLRCCVGFADKLFGATAPLRAGAFAFNAYGPRGVVAAITPWNFPIVNAVIKLAPALAAGNTVVLKPSELSPSSALRIAELALEAGLPEGVLNVVPGLGPTVGSALALHPDVDMLTFTGSTRTGRKLMELSGRSTGKPLLLECGGKSPQIVFADVDDLDSVAAETVRSALWNQGQVCSARTRLIVHEQVKEALLEKVVARAGLCRTGPPLDPETTFGPLASPAQRDRVKQYVQTGLKAGARAVLQGAIQESGGCYVLPTIFDRVTPDMAIAREEIFGPVLCVQTFKTEEQAIALANGTDYGLVATVWTRDLGRGTRLAHAIRAGDVSVRTSGQEGVSAGCFLSNEPQRASGFGVELGLRGLQSYSTLKSITFSGH
jgi:acyl-CoA reductase-like NAD-dependent aldehyde dehydrogenase